MSGLLRVRVEAGRPYEVVVGPGALGEVAGLIPPGARRVAVVTQEAVGVPIDTGRDGEVFPIPEGEEAKSLATVEDLCRRMARAGFTRADALVAVGGGVVTDVAGFVASVYHRGIPYLNVATSLLAQVDAAIGGKTGVNLPEGKNLVGSFWHPVAVVCDTDVLATLPAEEMRSGLGEVAKYAFLGAPGLERLPLPEQVARCVTVKAAFVSADEREVSGRRALLNYGHTLAHAIEADALAGATEPVRHGEAVAVGLVCAAHLARRLGRVDDATVNRHRDVVGAFGLSADLPEGSDSDRLLTYMVADKKSMFSRGAGGLTFVLDGPAGLEIVDGVDPTDVKAALDEMRADADTTAAETALDEMRAGADTTAAETALDAMRADGGRSR